MKKCVAMAVVAALLIVLAGCPAAPEPKDSGSALDPMPSPADVPQDQEETASKSDSTPVEAAEQELPPLPKTSAESDTPAVKLLPADKPAEKSADKPAENPAQ